MRLPPWAIEALRNGVADVAKKASDAETLAKVKEQAKELFRDLPENASRGLDIIVKTATETAKSAVDQGRDTVLRWTERHHEIGTECMNASGILFDPRGHGTPVSDHVLQMGCDLLRGRCATEGLRDQIDQSLTKMLDLDGYHVAVANNLDAAIASIPALTKDRALVLHRRHAIRLPSGLPLPDAFGDCQINECGGVQTIASSDFDGIDHACIVLADDGHHPIEPIDLGQRDCITVAVVPIATLKETDLTKGEDGNFLPAADQLLRSGIDLVILAGGPATGGPDAGIIVGKQTHLETITGSKSWKTLRSSDAIAAMTLTAMTDSQPPALSTLINTNEDNLRNRADRMSIRLTADDEIEACEIGEATAMIASDSRWQLPSRQLRLRHLTHSASDWQRELAAQTPALHASVEDQDLVIDLRWVPASLDGQLADQIVNAAQ